MVDETPHSSAAARVLDIPELLEHILLALAETSDSRSCDSSYAPICFDEIEPLTSLSAVCRVDRMFYDSIKTSKKIQRLMQRPLFCESGNGGLYPVELPGNLVATIENGSCEEHFLGVCISAINMPEGDQGQSCNCRQPRRRHGGM